MSRIPRQCGWCITLAVAALGFAGAAHAQGWRWSVTPYVWAPEIGADVSINDHEVLEREADLKDVMDTLDFVAQAHVEGQNGRHGLLFDATYYDLGDDDHRFALDDGGEVVIKGDLEMTILEAAGIYNPRADGSGVTLIYGTRLLDLDEELDARYDFGPGSTPGRRYTSSGTFFDGMVGARYVAAISERWSAILRADVSAGGTELTWNAWTGLGWTFGAARQNTLFLGYRYMEVEFKEDDARAEVETQTKLGGFITGIRFGL
jgi:hypothetical protein